MGVGFQLRLDTGVCVWGYGWQGVVRHAVKLAQHGKDYVVFGMAKSCDTFSCHVVQIASGNVTR